MTIALQIVSFCQQKNYRFDTGSGIYDIVDGILIEMYSKVFQTKYHDRLMARNQTDSDKFCYTIWRGLAAEMERNLRSIDPARFLSPIRCQVMSGSVGKTHTWLMWTGFTNLLAISHRICCQSVDIPRTIRHGSFVYRKILRIIYLWPFNERTRK